jgi:plasmid maintenance system antidote protein VapI
MSAYDAFFERAANKLADFERQIDDIRADDPRRADRLASTVRVHRDRLNELRRAGADVTPEMTQSFAAGLERLGAQFGEISRRAA